MTTGTMAIPLKMLVCIAAACCLYGFESKSDDADKAAPPAGDPMLGKKAGEVRDDNGLKMKFVWCPRGSVAMNTVAVRKEPGGDIEDISDDPPNEKPRPPRVTVHRILVKAFVADCWIGKCEVTRSEWKQVMGSEPWSVQAFGQEGDDYPVTHVSWDDAVAFCTKLTWQERTAGRLPEGWEITLPTEAQWEHACRARSRTDFYFGDDASKLPEHAWYVENTRGTAEPFAHRVGQKKPNAWGLYDMHGNVSEWCKDDYMQTIRGGVNPEVTTADSERVVRGGSWNDNPTACRCSDRFGNSTSRGSVNLGFRAAICAVRPAEPGEGRGGSANFDK